MELKAYRCESCDGVVFAPEDEDEFIITEQNQLAFGYFFCSCTATGVPRRWISVEKLLEN